MTRTEFRKETLKLIEKADKINNTIGFTDVIVSFTNFKGFDCVSLTVNQYKKMIYTHTIDDTCKSDEIANFHNMLDEIGVF